MYTVCLAPSTTFHTSALPLCRLLKCLREGEQPLVNCIDLNVAEVCPAPTTKAPKITSEISLSGDYEQVVGSKKVTFLRECTNTLSSKFDVECSNVRSGSIILELRGSRPEVAAAQNYVVTNGIKFPSFPALKAATTTTKPGEVGNESVRWGVGG